MQNKILLPLRLVPNQWSDTVGEGGAIMRSMTEGVIAVSPLNPHFIRNHLHPLRFDSQTTSPLQGEEKYGGYYG